MTRKFLIAMGSHEGDWRDSDERRFYSTVVTEKPEAYVFEDDPPPPFKNLIQVIAVDDLKLRIDNLQHALSSAPKELRETYLYEAAKELIEGLK